MPLVILIPETDVKRGDELLDESAGISYIKSFFTSSAPNFVLTNLTVTGEQVEISLRRVS